MCIYSNSNSTHVAKFTATHFFSQQLSWLIDKTYHNVAAVVNKANYTNECIVTECDRDQWTCKSGQCIPVAAYCNDIPDCLDNSDEENCPTIPPYFTTTYSPYPPTRPPVTTQPPFYTTTPYPGQQPGFAGKISLKIHRSGIN